MVSYELYCASVCVCVCVCVNTGDAGKLVRPSHLQSISGSSVHVNLLLEGRSTSQYLVTLSMCFLILNTTRNLFN